MANLNIPDGFKPVGEIRLVVVQEAGAAVYPGDPIALTSDGQIDPVAGGSTINGVALTYASAAGQKVLVSCDPEQIYEVQADETEMTAQSIIGNNCDHILGTPSTTYKMSRAMLNSDGVTAGAAGWTVIGLAGGVNNAFGAQAKMLVRPNEHQVFGKDGFAGI